MLINLFILIICFHCINSLEFQSPRLYDDDSLNTATWYCIDIQSTNLHPAVVWKTENCTKNEGEQPLLVVNSVSIDVTNPNIRLVPQAAVDNFPIGLATVPDMGKINPNFIAGINGGYFWRVDISGVWIDDVCWGKTRADAEKAANSNYPNYGIGDGIVKIDGVLKSSNCNCTGYSRPAVITLDGINSNIEVLHRGEAPSTSVTNAIAGGPSIVTYDETNGAGFVEILSDDDNINILEHAANTGVGIIYGTPGVTKATKVVLVTTDGSDECGPKDSSCGLTARGLGTLMLDHFNVAMATSMDQGGSTTMWVQGVNPDRDGVVSRSHNTVPADQDGPRNVANGLFVQVI